MVKRKPLPYQKGYHRRHYGGKKEIFKTIPMGKKHRKTVKRRTFKTR